MRGSPNFDTNNVIPVYGNNATGYLEPPTSIQISSGVVPLDSLPADWWNWLWNNTTKNLNSACLDINALYSELIAVLTAAGISPQDNSTTQLKDAIVALSKVIATTTSAGAIKSSGNAGQVSINAEGLGSINCLGSPTSLATTNKTIVGAINELNTALSTLTGTTLPGSYAPLSHASTGTTYGAASTTQYGHIKVTTGNGLSISNGVLSMGNAVISTTTYPGACCTGTVTAVCYNGTKYNPTSGVVNLGNAVISTTTYPGACCTGTVTAVCYNGTKYNPTSGVVNLGNAPTGFPGYYTGTGLAPGTACAGTSTLVSRGDHVHPFPWTGSTALAIGCEACALGSCSVAIGKGACVSSIGVAIGKDAYSCGNTVAIGVNAYACVPLTGCCGIYLSIAKHFVAFYACPGALQCNIYKVLTDYTMLTYSYDYTYYYPASGITSNGCNIDNIRTCPNCFIFRKGTTNLINLCSTSTSALACGFSVLFFAKAAYT